MREKSLGVPVKQLSSPRVKGFRCTPHSCFKSTPRIELPAEQLKFQSTPRAKREANCRLAKSSHARELTSPDREHPNPQVRYRAGDLESSASSFVPKDLAERRTLRTKAATPGSRTAKRSD